MYPPPLYINIGNHPMEHRELSILFFAGKVIRDSGKVNIAENICYFMPF